MHPPLDRPHPMCQNQIDALKTCHATSSKLKFWACNEVKFAVDRCFKAEKRELLVSVNLDFESKRKQEDEAIRDAIGREESFEEYLKTDKTYLKEMEKAKKSTKVYSERANAR
jgi:COX assembly protein 2